MTAPAPDSDLSALSVLPPDRAGELQKRTRGLLREWLTIDDARLLAAIGLLGRDAIARGAGQAARLPSGPSAASEAEAILGELRVVVEQLAAPDAPSPRARFRLFAPAAPPPVVDPEARLADLLARLERTRDGLMRERLRLAGERERIVAADRELDQVAHLLTGMGPRLEAAAREIAGEAPARAALLRGEASALLTERLRDVLAQLVVTRQGVLTLDLLAEGHDALAGAVARTGTTMLAALRTALAARRAIAEGTRMTAQADALDRIARAAEAADDRGEAARRALADAVAQMRRALESGSEG